MNIPEGVNFIEFYKAAQAKGVQISSRYNGVCAGKTNRGRDVCWRAIWMINGVSKSKKFPFTKHGELAAHQYYMKMRKKFKKYE